MKIIKNICFVVLAYMIFTVSTVSALEKTFTNSNDVTMSMDEKKSVEILFGKDYINKISKKEFEHYQKYFQNPNEIEHMVFPLSTNDKSLNASVIRNGNDAVIFLKLTWLRVPYIKSYDVMGIRYGNVTFKNLSVDIANPNFATVINTEYRSNGFGTIIQLKNSNPSTITQVIEVSGSGNVYASYQHSNQNISLLDARSFSISANGLGNVFDFNKNYLFDNMSGIVINV